MPDPPRCDKCGRVPPIRKVSGSAGIDSITYQCCGEVFVIRVRDLTDDTKLSEQEAA